MKKTIIFIPHYKGSFATLFQLALYIKDKKEAVPHFVLYFEDDSQARKTLRNHKIDFSTYKARWFTKMPLIGPLIKLLADLIYSVSLVNRLSPVQAMVCAVETHKLEYALISVLKRRKINTIVLQWAQTVPKEYYQSVRNKTKADNIVSMLRGRFKKYIRGVAEKIFSVKFAESYGEGDAKYFAVMGPYYREMFCSQGVSEKKLMVTGHPEFDRLYELSLGLKNPGFKQTIVEDFGLDSAKPIWILAREAIVYFKLVSREKDKEDICTILEILSEYHPEVQIVLKLHPRDSVEYYDFVKNTFPHVVVIHECDLYSLIAACDLYISQISNTMMWAIALDKPIISYDFNSQPHWHYFRDKEGIIKADSPRDLAEKVQAIKEEGLSPEDLNMCQVARERYMTFDGKARQRITELITKEI
jgi:glycosyltransferase involved in cell wall biosynthesis